MSKPKLDLSDAFQRVIMHLTCSDPKWLDQHRQYLKPEYFDRPEHGAMVGILNAFYDKHGVAPDFDVLEDLVRSTVENPDLLKRSMREISDIRDAEIPISKMRHASDRLAEFATAQHIKECIRLGAIAVDAGDVEEARHALSAVEDVGKISLDDSMIYFDEDSIEERASGESEAEIVEKIPTLYKSLDRRLRGGSSRKEMHVLMAPTHRGKSVGLVNIGTNALYCGAKVLHCTCEMSAKKSALRYDMRISGMGRDDIEGSPKVFKERMMHFHRMYKGNLVIKEYPSRSASMQDIENYMKFLARKHNFWPDMLIVDYLDELKRPKRDNEAYAVGDVASAFRACTMRHNIVGWTATQTTRDGFSKPRIDLDDVGDSFEKVKIADVVIGMCQTKEEEDDQTQRWYMLKNRDNARNTKPILMRTAFDHMVFKDVTDET